jgi:hypothetical protein
MAAKTKTQKTARPRQLSSVRKARISKPSRLHEIAGCLSDSEAIEMKKNIQAAFENVDPNAW